MVDLLKYGFTKEKETENSIEYIGHGFRITTYVYLYKTGDDKEVERRTFVVRTKQITSEAKPLEQLEIWLNDNSITIQQ